MVTSHHAPHHTPTLRLQTRPCHCRGQGTGEQGEKDTSESELTQICAFSRAWMALLSHLTTRRILFCVFFSVVSNSL